MSYIQIVVSWLRANPLFVTVVLFVISSLLALYPQEIRRFLHEWPRTRRMIRKYHFNVAKNKIEELKCLHGNSYELNLWFYGTILVLFVNMFVLTLIFMFAVYVVEHRLPDIRSFGGVYLGVAFGKAMNMVRVMIDLHNYENAIARLQKRMLNNADLNELAHEKGG